MLDPRVFFDFEVNNRLFDIKDDNNVRVWDIVRYEVYNEILNQTCPKSSNSSCGPVHNSYYTRRFLMLIPNIFRILFARMSKADYFTLINSRDNVDGVIVDRNQIAALNVIGQDKIIAEESFNDVDLRNSYHFKRSFSLSGLSLFIKLNRKKFDFSKIISLLDEAFPDIIFSKKSLLLEYRRFYAERGYYKSLFKGIKPKGVFFSQSGIQKGIKAACEELHIPSYEFQHGIVESSNMAYSYPQIDLTEKAYLPSVIFSFSEHWFHSFYSPEQINIIPIGNNFLYSERETNQDTHKLIVVSNNMDGNLLASFIIDCLKDNFWTDYHIYFKLHPNQFNEYEYYLSFFKEYGNVDVISNQFSVPVLLKECSTIFLIQSTATYEALQRGTKVCLLTKESFYNYKIQSDVFDNPNVYFISEPSDLKSAVTKPRVSFDKQYFAPFNKDMFIETLSHYE